MIDPTEAEPGTPSHLAQNVSAFARRFARASANELVLDGRKVLVKTLSQGLPHLSFNRTRTALLRMAGIRIGVGSWMMGTLNITGPGDVRTLLSIGDGTLVTGPLHVDLGASVRIGRGVRLGHDVMLLTIDHEIGPSSHRCGRLLAAPIAIGHGAWLGSRVTVLPGTSVGAGAVVAAGAVVSRDVPPNTLVAGVPARFVRDLDGDAPRSERRERAVLLEEEREANWSGDRRTGPGCAVVEH